MKLLKLIKKDLNGTKGCPKHYQLLIYLDWIAFDKTYREQKAHFRVSFEAICKARREVGKAVMKNIYPKYVHLPSDIPNLRGKHYTTFFQGCYGCVDGSHFPVMVPSDEKEDWLNRKGGISTNGMLMCSSDNSLRFIYANFGAEGNGGDSVILRMCANDLGMEWLGGNYLLIFRHILIPPLCIFTRVYICTNYMNRTWLRTGRCWVCAIESGVDAIPQHKVSLEGVPHHQPSRKTSEQERIV